MSAMDLGGGADSMGVRAGVALAEAGRHRTRFGVEKWDADQLLWTHRRLDLPPHVEPAGRHFAAVGLAPFDVYELDDCNLITDIGWTQLMNGVAGSAVTKFVSGVTGRIGLGVTATAPAYADTALTGIGALTTANWKVINAVPTVGNHTTGLILAANFGLTEANGVAILEFGTDLGTTSTLSAAAVGGLFSHGLASPGTKTAAQTWNVTVTITWT